MRAHENTVREFLNRLGHPVALVGRKPVDDAPKSMVLWPVEQDDPADQACWLSRQYHCIFCNLNPLVSELLCCKPQPGISVRDNMIARRTRLLIDIDGHDVPKEVAREQKDVIKARYPNPLMETDSGNGFGLIYEIDYLNDTDAKRRIQMFLQQLKDEFSCVDTTVYGAGRLTRVIGTLNRSSVDGSRIRSELLN